MESLLSVTELPSSSSQQWGNHSWAIMAVPYQSLCGPAQHNHLSNHVFPPITIGSAQWARDMAFSCSMHSMQNEHWLQQSFGLWLESLMGTQSLKLAELITCHFLYWETGRLAVFNTVWIVLTSFPENITCTLHPLPLKLINAQDNKEI